jgi:hypothetical protein
MLTKGGPFSFHHEDMKDMKDQPGMGGHVTRVGTVWSGPGSAELYSASFLGSPSCTRPTLLPAQRKHGVLEDQLEIPTRCFSGRPGLVPRRYTGWRIGHKGKMPLLPTQTSGSGWPNAERSRPFTTALETQAETA